MIQTVPEVAIPTTSKKSRIVIIDALRGFALAGVALAHFTEQYIAGPPPAGFMEGLNGLPDQIVQGLIGFLISGKFFALFSILFGLSFFIQMDAADRRGQDFSLRFLWRAVLLFVIGYVHQLFYRGDILTIYAMLVPFLIPFHRLNSRWILLAAGIFFLSVPRFISYFIWGNEALFGLPSDWNNPLEEAYYATIKSGSLTEVFAQNAVYGMKTKMNYQLLFMGRFYYTFGYFLLGLWIGKVGIFQAWQEKLPWIRKVLKYTAISIVPMVMLGGLAFSLAPQPIDFSSIFHVLALNNMEWANVAMTIIIMCGFVLLYPKRWWHRKLAFFAPYGRMALTNYIVQALIGTCFFFGWGLGFLGEVRTLYLFLLAIGVIGLQAIWSKWWLQHFKYGPLEWLWRSATYLKWQAIR
ncbi:MAG: DUF418 domain-containing protein [Bacteroidota bacterium]